MTQRLRYTGTQAITIKAPLGIGQVEKNDEFDVRDEDVIRFLRRADFEHAGDCPKPPCACGQEPDREPADPAPARKRRRPATPGGDVSQLPGANEPGDQPDSQ